MLKDTFMEGNFIRVIALLLVSSITNNLLVMLWTNKMRIVYKEILQIINLLKNLISAPLKEKILCNLNFLIIHPALISKVLNKVVLL